MSLPSFVQEGGRAGGALAVVGQPLPGGTAPWGGGSGSSLPSLLAGSPTPGCLRPPRPGAWDVPAAAYQDLMWKPFRPALASARPRSHRSPAAAFCLREGPAPLLPGRQHGSQERGCRTSKSISIPKQINQSIRSRPP